MGDEEGFYENLEDYTHYEIMRQTEDLLGWGWVLEAYGKWRLEHPRDLGVGAFFRVLELGITASISVRETLGYVVISSAADLVQYYRHYNGESLRYLLEGAGNMGYVSAGYLLHSLMFRKNVKNKKKQTIFGLAAAGIYPAMVRTKPETLTTQHAVDLAVGFASSLIFKAMGRP